MKPVTINQSKLNVRAHERGLSLFAFLIPLVMLLIWIAWAEHAQWQQARQTIIHSVSNAARSYADNIRARLDTQFIELQFAAVVLLGPNANPARPSPQTVEALTAFTHLHPEFFAFNIQSADGNRILWSTQKQSSRPITPGSAFTPLAKHPDYLMGRVRYASRVGAAILTMRYRLRDKNNQIRFMVGSPYRIRNLLRLTATDRQQLSGLTLEVADRRNQKIIARWTDDRWTYLPQRNRSESPPEDQPEQQNSENRLQVDVADYPFTVSVQGLLPKIWERYLSHGFNRWLAELLTLVLTAVLFGGLITLTRRLAAAKYQAEYRAGHDPLTDLPNRAALMEHLNQAIARAQRQGSALAVGVLDLDDFKPINDQLGHAAGDALLRAFSLRMHGCLRETDFLARLGGDEFVLVFEDLLEAKAKEQIGFILPRLHDAIETPVDLGKETCTFGMSLGLALYPQAGKDAEHLMRAADQAMYQAKAQKHQRTQWWQFSGESQTAPTEPVIELTAFDDQSINLLTRIQPLLDDVADVFVDTFYRTLERDPEGRDILATLSEHELHHLKEQQLAHLRFLLDPATTEEQLRTRAKHVGQVHTLIGVSGRLLIQSLTIYLQEIGLLIGQTLLTAKDRFQLERVIEMRFALEMQEELVAQDEVLNRYLDVLSLSASDDPFLIDTLKSEMRVVGDMPGIVVALLMRLNTDGAFVIEQASGPEAETAVSGLQRPEFRILIDAQSPHGQGLIPQCWRTQMVLSSPTYVNNPKYAVWRSLALSIGVRSHIAIPIIDSTGHTTWVLSLYGRYPHQFEAPVMRHFAHGLQHRFEQFSRQRRKPTHTPVPIDQARLWIDHLFSGGLQLYVQPILNLKQNQVVKVEFLARLRLPDGNVIAPGLFLPLLGDAEIDRLFRHGLTRALEQMTVWDEHGYRLDASLNLPPNTLLDPDCTNWVKEALANSSISADRLTLELLETQEIVELAQATSTILQLRGLGCHLAMDDVGSGFSNLLRITQMPFDVLKVDQGLVSRLHTDPVPTLGLIRAIIQIGQDFNHQVVVEGLEDEGMLEAVRLMGAEYGQGYIIARPMPADGLPAWLDAFRASQSRQTPEIHTLLGVLTTHLRLRPQIGGEGDKACDCPVHTFLSRWTGDTAEQIRQALHFHQQLHEAPTEQARKQAGHQLQLWLVERIKSEVLAD